MSTLTAPDRLMTIDEFYEFASHREERWELVGGRALMAPGEIGYNLNVEARLIVLFDRLLDGTWPILPHASVRVQGSPATVREPDVVVLWPGTDLGPWLFSPANVALAVEVISPSTRATDRVTKREEYATVGIPNYLIVDVNNPAEPRFTLFNRIVDTPDGPRYATPEENVTDVELHLDGHTVALRHTDLATR